MVLCLFVLAAGGPTTAQVQEDWIARVDSDGRSDRGLLAVRDSLGNVVVAGGSSGPGLESETLVTKHDPSGSVLWTRLLAGGSGMAFRPRGLAADAAGNILLTGYDIVSAQDHRMVTVMLDASGAEVWRQVFDVSGAFDDPVGLVLDASGDAVVAGTSQSQSGTVFIVTAAYGNNGSLLWQDTYDPGPDQEYAWDIARDPVSGAIYVSGSQRGAVLLRYDADGRRRWARRYPTKDVSTGNLNRVTVDPSGNVFIAGGYQPSNQDADIQVLKVNGSNGRLIWSALYGTPGVNDYVVEAAADGAGDLLVAANVVGTFSQSDRLLLKYKAGGTLDWIAVYDRDGLTDNATGLVVDAAGNAYVTGASAEFDGVKFDVDWATTRYDPSGVVVWTVFFDDWPTSGFDATASDILLGPSSAVIVTGTGTGAGTAADVVTIQYGQP